MRMLQNDFKGPTSPIGHTESFLMLSVPSRCTTISMFQRYIDVFLIIKIQIRFLKLHFIVTFSHSLFSPAIDSKGAATCFLYFIMKGSSLAIKYLLYLQRRSIINSQWNYGRLGPQLLEGKVKGYNSLNATLFLSSLLG